VGSRYGAEKTKGVVVIVGSRDSRIDFPAQFNVMQATWCTVSFYLLRDISVRMIAGIQQTPVDSPSIIGLAVSGRISGRDIPWVVSEPCVFL
jgi:hypothetical protein